MSHKATIYYHDIGDYLSREEKLAIIRKLGSVDNTDMQWQILTPNEHNDWINHRNNRFAEFISLAPEKKFDAKTESFFTTNVIAVSSNRDAWVYNFSRQAVAENMQRMIDFYNEQSKAFVETKGCNPLLQVEDFIDTDESKISWTVNLKKNIEKEVVHNFMPDARRIGMYRPFAKQWLYYDDPFIERPGLSRKLFPLPNIENIVICVSSSPNDGLSLLISDKIANLHFNGDTQCFPLY